MMPKWITENYLFLMSVRSIMMRMRVVSEAPM